MKHKPEHINYKAFVLYLEHFQCKNTALFKYVPNTDTDT